MSDEVRDVGPMQRPGSSQLRSYRWRELESSRSEERCVLKIAASVAVYLWSVGFVSRDDLAVDLLNAIEERL